MQCSTHPKQALCAIGFEDEFKNGEIDLVSFKLDESPQALKKARARVPLHEKFHFWITNLMSSIGLGLSCTVGVLFRFIAPIAIGGMGLVIPPVTLTIISSVFLTIAGYCAYRALQYTSRDVIKNVGMLLNQHDHYQKKLREKENDLLKKFQQSFKMLLMMQLALEELRKKRLNLNIEKPTPNEQNMQKRINEYTNFLVGDPNHANLQRITDIHKKTAAIVRTNKRQALIKEKLTEASQLILTSKMTVKCYLTSETNNIRRCFPSLRLRAPTTNPPRHFNWIPVIYPGVTCFFGTLAIYSTVVNFINALALASIAFPFILPVVAGVALIIACGVSYAVYNTKKLDEKRNVHLKDLQKQLAYYTRADKLMTERHAKEFKKYVAYRSIPEITPETKQENNTSVRDLTIFNTKVPKFSIPEPCVTQPPAPPEDTSFEDTRDIAEAVVKRIC